MKIVSIIVILLLNIQVWAQNPMLNSSNKKAMKMYEEGLEYYARRQFDPAHQMMLKAVKMDPEFVNAHVFLSKMYKQIYFDKDNWIKHTEIAANLAPNSPQLASIFMDYAAYLFYQGQYEDALVKLNQVLATHPRDQRTRMEAEKLVKEAKYGIEATKKPLNFMPVKMNSNINFAEGNYLPSITADQSQLLYTALVVDGKHRNEDVMISQKVDGVWQKSKSISENINSATNEGASSISGDGQTMVFTRCGDPSGFGRCDLYVSYWDGSDWSIPENLGATINGKSWDSQPSLSTDGRTLYFVSDRKGGFGGEDIYVADKVNDSTWSVARNMGNKVNTPDREMSPFIHANGQTLYFATTGNYEMNLGGFDLFKFNVITREPPQNIGYPVNTSKNETTLCITADSKKGYFSKDEPTAVSKRATFIYEFDVPDEVKPHAMANYAIGEVFDAKTGAKLAATIEVFDLGTDALFQKVKADAVSGKFLCTLNEGDEYAVYVTHPGYLHESVNFNYKGKDNMRPEALKIGLKRIEKGQSIVLNNIFFETASYELDDKSQSELDKLVKLLQDNATIKVEVSGHTDDVGNTEDNKTLSNNRATSVKKYLETNGISTGRIISVGWGESKPLVDNTSDENRAKNRRIEFKII